MSHARPLAALALALCSAALLPARPSGAQATGGFTDAQAQTGRRVYAAQCAVCHNGDLSGGAGPALAGDTFIRTWSGRTADDLHSYASTQMPQTAPGSLKPADYLALVAYILLRNGYKPGSTELTPAALKTIVIKKQ
jgi:mono/diheme cytochrome c family protein